MNKKYLIGEKIESLFEVKDFHLISIKEECMYCTVMYLAERDFEFRAVGHLTKDEFSSLRKGSIYLIRGVFQRGDIMSRKTQRRRKKNAKQENKKSMKQILIDEARPFFQKYKNDATRKTYESNFEKYVDFCRMKYNVKTKEECSLHLQDYVEFLEIQGKSASTIHTYITTFTVKLITFTTFQNAAFI